MKDIKLKWLKVQKITYHVLVIIWIYKCIPCLWITLQIQGMDLFYDHDVRSFIRK